MRVEISWLLIFQVLEKLKHPIGLAAGFDKNADAPKAFKDLNLASIELGTVTQSPQQGNEKTKDFLDTQINDQLL